MTHSVRFINSIHEIGAKTWKLLLHSDNPFLRFEFLAALEDGQCIDTPSHPKQLEKPLNSGWIPHYAVLENDALEILAIAPVFKKLHSFGEYVFDWSWADAYEHHGLCYYPKLVWAIPFTPSTGPRIIGQGRPELIQRYYQQIASALTQYCQQHDYSSWHCLFPNAMANEALSSPAPRYLSNGDSDNKIMQRQSCQFHWFNKAFTFNDSYNETFNGSLNDVCSNDDKNRFTGTTAGFKDFDHYLETFTSRKRKNIKKERAKLRDAGFIFKQKAADEITAEDIKIFYHCYQLTYVKRNRLGYLTLEFFQQIIKTMPEQILLVQALHEDRSDCEKIVASALYFKDANNLYGRYWGCLAEYDSLHFECCYYQGIEYCIDNHIHHFDPGTQGEHKISRGFQPTICSSQHWIAHPQFSDAIDDFIKDENDYMHNYARQVIEHLPFKQTT